MKSSLVFLTKEFYEDHSEPSFREIEHKVERPYIVLLVKIEDKVWGLPFRSHIRHEHAFWTDKPNRCGIDYSKAVMITDQKYIDKSLTPHLRQNEFEAIRGQEFNIYKGFLSYINKYRKAKKSGHPRYRNLLEFSTLQNYPELFE